METVFLLWLVCIQFNACGKLEQIEERLWRIELRCRP